jgi:hypothetical protein
LAGDASAAVQDYIYWSNPTSPAYNKVFEGYHLSHDEIQTIENFDSILTYKGVATEATLKEIVIAPEAFNEYVEDLGIGVPLDVLYMCK